ncbi:MAG: coenzyme F420-0:L-glutamate ligase [Candidatus Beckwithbacteria bacterium]
MNLNSIKTSLVKPKDDLFLLIKRSIKSIPENSVLAITSKIFSYSQNRLVKKITAEKSEKHNLVRQEADFYLDPSLSQYDTMLTIKNNILAVNAGIDESNAANFYLLWPKNLQSATNQLWIKLRRYYQLKNFGLIITDSKTTPLKWGVTGTCIAHCGFAALNDYRGRPDLFGRKMKMTQVNVAEALAVVAVYEMGETNQSTPLCLIQSIPFIKFSSQPPTKKELFSLKISLEDDVYAPLLTSVSWKNTR